LSVLTVCLSVCLSVCNVGALWQNGWMDQDSTWYGAIASAQATLTDGDPAPLRKRAEQPPLSQFTGAGPMSIVAKRSPISATAERLLHQLVLYRTSRDARHAVTVDYRRIVKIVS